MFDSVRFFGMTSGMVVAVTAGIGIAAADPKKIDVKLKNELGVTVEVKSNLFSGEYQSAAGGDPRTIGSIDDGKTFTWTATPKDKATFASCSGSQPIKGPSANTVTMTKDRCKAASVSTAPTTNTTNAGSSGQGGKPSGSAGAMGTQKIHIVNTMNTGVHLRMTDNLGPNRGARDVDLGLPTGSQSTTDVDVGKQDGKIDFYINLQCHDSGNAQSDTVTYIKPIGVITISAGCKLTRS